MSGTYQTTVISWPTVAALALVLATLCVVWVTSPDHRGDILAGVGALGAVLLAALPGALRRARILVPLLLVALPLASGCGASALRTHATVGTVAAVAVASTAPLVAPACDVALTDCHGDAACVDRTGDACLAASRAHDAARAGVSAYLDAIEVAALADEGEVLPALATGLRGLASLWEAARVALAPLHVELPALPPVVLTLLGGAS